MEKVEIESFTLDHTKVKAPYVRLISEEKGPNGDIVSNFDVRFMSTESTRDTNRSYAYFRTFVQHISSP